MVLKGLYWEPQTTVQRVENARREAREVCSNVKITGRRGIFRSARSPGGRAGRRQNSEKNPANCAAAVVSRARRRLSMPGAAYSAGRAVVFSMTVWTCSLRETQRHSHTETRTQVVFVTASARHCPCPGCNSLLGHGPAPARELVCTVQSRSTVLSPGSFRSCS